MPRPCCCLAPLEALLNVNRQIWCLWCEAAPWERFYDCKIWRRRNHPHAQGKRGNSDQKLTDHGELEPPEFKSTVNLYNKRKLRPWSEFPPQRNSEGREWGVGSVVVEFGVFGAPRFSVQRSQNTCFKGFWDLWTEKSGRPKSAKFNHDGFNPPFSALWETQTMVRVNCQNGDGGGSWVGPRCCSSLWLSRCGKSSQRLLHHALRRFPEIAWRLTPIFERGEKTPTPKISALLRKRPVLLRANFVLTKDRKRPYYGHCCGKMHREGSCSKVAGGPY